MDLESKINADIKQAMLAREKDKLEALRAIKSAVLLAKTEKVGAELDSETELRLLQKLVKQRRDSALIYHQQNRPDMAGPEEFQASVIEAYLPEQMSEDKVRELISAVVTQLGATSVKDMGKVMAEASKQIAGRADGKLIASLVKEKLS
jgi:uncharacterized protein YqeY